ncbi:diaminopimelate epimerase [uncultured Faecalibaculum sp.]|uniref:diaminopimelate epimerase n=1 Tax=uncultured Faecalibaculum sp. TaxID=1729681 RepID=UPI00262E2D19|nr:diaminopimelate epimerase [uncultured Faecalibaculum sp.]
MEQRAIPVTKYHGCGNDFVIVRAADVEGMDLPALAVRVCDRHTGIGADGFIVAETGPLEMIYYNQDGTRAPMCGNGIRCFAAFCLQEGLASGTGFDVVTLAGTKHVTVLGNDRYRIMMGEPDFSRETIGTPFQVDHYLLNDHEITSFFMGTIHTVVFTDNAMGNIEVPGREICHASLFPQQTNVNFVEVVDRNHLRVQTYERGCGVTLACGTGVCASAFQAWREGLANPSVDVELKCGLLHIDIEDGIVYMSGPAVRILKGDYYL